MRLGMAAEKTAATAKDLAEWFSPADALLAVQHVFGKEAANVIWERLCGGVMKAAASTTSRASPPEAEPELNSTPSEIPARYWASHFQRKEAANFWQSGDARFFFSAGSRHTAHNTVIRCFGIKLDPVGLRQMVAGIPAIIQKQRTYLWTKAVAVKRLGGMIFGLKFAARFMRQINCENPS